MTKIKTRTAGYDLGEPDSGRGIVTDEQRAELDYRIARLEQNPSDVIPWEQVRAGLFKKP